MGSYIIILGDLTTRYVLTNENVTSWRKKVESTGAGADPCEWEMGWCGMAYNDEITEEVRQAGNDLRHEG